MYPSFIEGDYDNRCARPLNDKPIMCRALLDCTFALSNVLGENIMCHNNSKLCREQQGDGKSVMRDRPPPVTSAI
jgi:hypothetical protein